ncbi:MAG: hypothetical protein AB8C46_21280 [Burkholderiaceae bacterium]
MTHDPTSFIGLPTPNQLDTVATSQYFSALENFFRVFALRPEDNFLFLADDKLDPRVIHAICGLARSRGVEPRVLMSHTTQHTDIPDDVKPMLEKATFVVSTWFCSVIDPFCIKLRQGGQRWVKITYFRNLDLLQTEQARFPIDLVGEIIRATAKRYPVGQDFNLHFTDPRGTELSIGFTADMRERLLQTTRWRGAMCCDEPGAYVHYLPCHGPNVYDRTSVNNDDSVLVPVNGVVYPQWAVGFEKPFDQRIGVLFRDDRVSDVQGDGELAEILRDMLVGGQLIELGCGFNPKAPRHTIYPAGSNSPGALHYGIDLAKPSDYIRRVMPDWEEPPVHMDLISFDSTLRAGSNTVIEDGFLSALRDPAVVEAAKRYGDPIDLLERWPD